MEHEEQSVSVTEVTEVGRLWLKGHKAGIEFHSGILIHCDFAYQKSTMYPLGSKATPFLTHHGQQLDILFGMAT